MELRHEPPPLDDLLALYGDAGWTAYTRDPALLRRAVHGSTWLAALWERDRLVGLVRAISDDASMAYLQDLLVHRDHRRQGHGRRLVEAFLDRFAHCRQKVLLTDAEPAQKAFYDAVGFQNVGKLRLNAFVRLER